MSYIDREIERAEADFHKAMDSVPWWANGFPGLICAAAIFVATIYLIS